MKVVVAQAGARMHYAVPQIFHNNGMLERLFTDTYIGNKPTLQKILGSLPHYLRPRIVERLLGRTILTIPSAKVTSFEIIGLAYKIRRRLFDGSNQIDSVYAQFGRDFCKSVVRKGCGDAQVVWAFNGCALELFQHAKSLDLLCILEQTMAPHAVNASLMQTEEARWPEFKLNNDQRQLQLTSEREEAEWQLADVIVCPSQFVVDGIAERGGPVDRCRVIPYGVSIPNNNGKIKSGCTKDGKLHVLFCGEVGLRKGAPYLLKALERLGSSRVEGQFAGQLALNHKELQQYSDVARFLGRVPRTEVSALFQWADVLVLPSLCEGSATVIYEALSLGLPVICTPNSGPPDTDGIRIIPAGDIDSLVLALEEFTGNDQTPESRPFLSDEYTLQGYGRRIARLMSDVGDQLIRAEAI